MSNRAEYEHKALRSPRSIRVIKLKGTSGGLFRRSGPDQPLKIELEEVSLDKFPSFEALSYTWDGQSPDRPIQCHGKIMNITRNCEVALFRLRTKSQRHLWVDSICIDQKSTSEKNSQVPLMGEIYGQAKTVLVWLGEGTEASDRSFQYLKDVAALTLPTALYSLSVLVAGTTPTLPQAVEQEIFTLRLAFEEENKKIYSRAGTPESTMLRDVFERSWFSRMWTIQELVLGFNALMLCGKSEIKWSMFLNATACLGAMELKYLKANNSFFPQLEVYSKLRAAIHPQLAMIPKSQERSIYEFMIRVRHLHSGDPRDKLYALFGYFRRLGIKELPPVDYNLPVTRVYIEFTKAAILQDQSLEILYELGGNRSFQDLPSWVPDWSRANEASRIDHKSFKASKASQLQFSFEDNDELHMSGIVIDTIKQRADSSLPSEASVSLLHRNLPEEYLPLIIKHIHTWQQWALLAAQVKPHCTNEPFDRFFLKTILRNSIDEDALEPSTIWLNILTAYHPINATYKEECVAIVDEIVEWALQRPALWALYFTGDIDPIPIINTPEWRTMIALADRGQEKQGNLHQKIVQKTKGMTLFTTQNGHLGTGSDSIQAGDQVVLISGMSLPMIVRRHNDGFSNIVAPAYINGIMNGEMWPRIEDINLTNFVFK